jgi:phthalate 4,5-cis-dihydrodiol dehydrogenase
MIRIRIFLFERRGVNLRRARSFRAMHAKKPFMRVGVAGLGAGAVNALAANPGLSNHPNVTLTAGADPRPEAREAFAARYGATCYPSVEEMCKSPEVDVVYVLTPNANHAEHAIVAAEHGKQIVADKPMALSMDDCEAMIRAADRNGVRLLVGHSQSLDSGIIKMAEIVRSGELGRPTLITSTYYSEWLYRPRSAAELDPATREGSLTLRQGWVQFDTIRMLGGGMLRSVRGTTVVADPNRPVDGAYAAFMEFEDGVPATAVFDAYGHFDSAELTFGLGLYGLPRTSETNIGAHRQMAGLANREAEYALKNDGRVGGKRARTKLDAPVNKHQMFGLTIVSCERGAIRQSPDGLKVYGRDAWREVPVEPRLYAEIELDVMYRAWSADAPLETHDGRWGKATTEVCLAVLQSAADRREIRLQHQVAAPG